MARSGARQRSLNRYHKAVGKIPLAYAIAPEPLECIQMYVVVVGRV